MAGLLQFLEHIGNASVLTFWVPVLVWTALAGVAAFWLAMARNLHPLGGYRLRQALLLALPASILVGPWLPELSLPVARAPAVEPLTRATAGTLEPAVAPTALRPESLGPAASGSIDGSWTPADAAPGMADPLRVPGIDIAVTLLGLAVVAVVLLAVVRLSMLAAAAGKLHLLGRTAPRIGDPSACRLLKTLAGQLGVRRPVELREGPPGCIPATFGTWRPIVICPPELLESPDSLRAVLLHELIHVRRGDHMWALLDCLTAAAFAFHPLVRVLRRGILHYRETSCDAEVLSAGRVPVVQYAELLVRTHTANRVAIGTPAATFFSQPSSLRQRLETIRRFGVSRRTLQRPGRLVIASVFVFAGLAFASGATTVGVAADRSPQRPETLPVLNPSHVLGPGQRFQDCPDCPEMVVVPPGSFLMGSAPSEDQRRLNEGPQRRVTIPGPFAVGVYEVTFLQWDACVRGGGCRGYRPDDEGWGRGALPVTNVSWEDAQAYVAWLSEEAGAEYRLPSEAQWQYAARAGTRTARYWGESDAEQCRYANGADEVLREHDPDPPIAFCSDGYAQTAPVGSFRPNGFGLHDVMGNVQEWTQDCWSGGYWGDPVDGGPHEPDDCPQRNLSGGSWALGPWHLRSASRFGAEADARHHGFGFRVVRVMQ